MYLIYVDMALIAQFYPHLIWITFRAHLLKNYVSISSEIKYWTNTEQLLFDM